MIRVRARAECGHAARPMRIERLASSLYGAGAVMALEILRILRWPSRLGLVSRLLAIAVFAALMLAASAGAAQSVGDCAESLATRQVSLESREAQ